VENEMTKKENGLIAEIIVFNLLKQRYGEQNVKWCSGYAKEAGQNDEGGDTLGYDIKIKDETNKIEYIEVKSSIGSEPVFYISSNEMRFATDHKENYILYFVKNLGDAMNIQIINLGKIFNFENGETFFNNSHFRISDESYKIFAKFK
jgi:hypothetical protein